MGDIAFNIFLVIMGFIGFICALVLVLCLLALVKLLLEVIFDDFELPKFRKSKNKHSIISTLKRIRFRVKTMKTEKESEKM